MYNFKFMYLFDVNIMDKREIRCLIGEKKNRQS